MFRYKSWAILPIYPNLTTVMLQLNRNKQVGICHSTGLWRLCSGTNLIHALMSGGRSKMCICRLKDLGMNFVLLLHVALRLILQSSLWTLKQCTVVLTWEITLKINSEKCQYCKGQRLQCSAVFHSAKIRAFKSKSLNLLVCSNQQNYVLNRTVSMHFSD